MISVPEPVTPVLLHLAGGDQHLVATVTDTLEDPHCRITITRANATGATTVLALGLSGDDSAWSSARATTS